MNELEQRIQDLESQIKEASRQRDLAHEKMKDAIATRDSAKKKLSTQEDFEKELERSRGDWEQQQKILFKSLETAKIQNALAMAAGIEKAYSPVQIVLSLDRAFKLDPETLEPVLNREFIDKMGINPYDANGKEKDVSAVVKAYVELNPNLVIPQGGAGAGVQSGRAQQTYVSGQIRSIPDDPAEREKMYQDLQRQAEAQGNK